MDRLVGGIIDQMRRDGVFHEATLIVLSDHGFRLGGRERDTLHIPFIVKRTGQRSRVDVTAPQRGELLLRQLVGGVCEAS